MGRSRLLIRGRPISFGVSRKRIRPSQFLHARAIILESPSRRPVSYREALPMARTKKKENKSAIFARLFQANQHLLTTPSIAEAIAQFEAEVGRSATDKDRGVAANVKSRLRRKLGMRRRRRRGRSAAANGVVAVARRVKA